MLEKDVAPACVLLVEDDPISRQMMTAVLADAGYTVRSAVNGARCLDAIADQIPDLVLMDVSMPEMDGLEACRCLRADRQTQDLPVIFVTASTDDDALDKAFEAGGNDYVRKPVNRAELLARVRSAIAQKRAVNRRVDDERLKGALETAGAVCHDLNQPLQFVLGSVQLLMLDIDEQDPRWQTLSSIRAKVELMGDITRKLMEITRYRSRSYVGTERIIDIEQSVGGAN